MIVSNCMHNQKKKHCKEHTFSKKNSNNVYTKKYEPHKKCIVEFVF